MQQTTQVPTETQAPATLDGVSIQDCQFTESVGKREPRPPLFSAVTQELGVMDGVFLSVNGGKVLVRESTLPAGREWLNPRSPRVQVGRWSAGAPKGPAYTGPITPAMWVWIRKYWNP